MTVRLLDVSRADAAATTVAETSFRWSAQVGDANDIPFALVVPALDERRDYAVAAHIDVTDSGDVSPEDYITTQHVGVSEQDADSVVVPVQGIG